MRHILRACAGILILLVLAGSTGCTGIPMASPEQDTQAKRFESPDGMAAVYLFRIGDNASGVLMPVGIDGQLMGRTAMFSYFYWKLTSGNHKIVTGGQVPKAYELNLKPGKIYFIRQNVFFDQGYNSALIDVDTNDGKQAVLRCKLAASSQPAPQNNKSQNVDTKMEDLKGLLQLQNN